MIDIQFFTTTLSSSLLAYLDPGTGSMVLQVLLASLLGGAMTIKLFWHKIKRALGLAGRKTAEPDSTENPSTSSNETPEN